MTKKKLTQDEREILKRLTDARFERKLTSKQKAEDRRRAESGGLQKHVKGEIVRSPLTSREQRRVGHELIKLPQTLDLVSHFVVTAEAIRSIRRLALKEKRPVMLDFSDVTTLRPSALLLLLAEIHRSRLMHGSSRMTGSYPKDPKIERMLDATGFFKLLGVKSRIKQKPQRYPMEHVGYHSEKHEVKGTVRKFRESLLGTKIVMSAAVRSRLYRAITEAMLNVSHHAYPVSKTKMHPERGRWWLTGSVNRKAGILTIMFCDLGVGIPDTLPKIYTMELIRSVLSLLPGIKPDDAQMIRAGMTIGRTATGVEGRGRGLNDLRRFVEDVGVGELHIFSRKGHYLYDPVNGDKIVNYGIGMGGTLIMWSVPIAAVTNWQSQDTDFDEYEADD
jgi:hypothetical protein